MSVHPDLTTDLMLAWIAPFQTFALNLRHMLPGPATEMFIVGLGWSLESWYLLQQAGRMTYK